MAQQPRSLHPYGSPEAFFGAQVRAWRVGRGLSQVRLGRLVHVSGDLVGKVEKAERRAHPELIAELDAALGAAGALVRCAASIRDPADARPGRRIRPEGALTTWPAPRAAALAAPWRWSAALTLLEEAVSATYTKASGGEVHAPVRELRAGVALLWRSYQASRFTEASTIAASMITSDPVSERPATSENDRCEIHRMLALTYHAAAATATKLGAPDLAWVCADRGLAMAEASHDPEATASLLRSVSHVLLSTGRFTAAANTASGAIDRLSARLDTGPVGQSLVGSLHLVAAMAAARSGDGSAARFWLAHARRAAARVGADGNHLWTAFGPSNVAIHELSVMVELGDLSAASRATPLPATCRLPLERRIRHDLEVAKIWSATGKAAEAVELVAADARRAPDHVRHHYLTRELVTTWNHSPVASRPQVQELARHLHLTDDEKGHAPS
jgi:transcriptional regulator with XRE-family HTH domain